MTVNNESNIMHFKKVQNVCYSSEISGCNFCLGPNLGIISADFRLTVYDSLAEHLASRIFFS